MSFSISHRPAMPPFKRRRTATSVMAGDFDAQQSRDALTSLLNGVGPCKLVEKDEETRRNKKKEKRERERERRKVRAAEKALKAEQATAGPSNATSVNPANLLPTPASMPNTTTSSFWRARARPAILMPSVQQRPSSVTPPSSARSTPEPSVASSVSRMSSKRPRTPSDHTDQHQPDIASSATLSPQPRKRRTAVRKGWKGWVEGSPPPSDKLISLDTHRVLPERRTRSGKSFDAIGLGKEGWV